VSTYQHFHRLTHVSRTLVSLTLLIVLFVAACSPGTTEAPTGEAPVVATDIPTAVPIQEDLLPKNAEGIPLVARVNNVEITLPQFQRMLARYQQQPVGNPAALPKLVLTTMIQQSLIDQAAASNNIDVTPQEVDTELQSLVQSAGGADQWQNWLNANGYTEDELRQTLHSTLLTNDMRDRITSDLGNSVPQVHARHIVVATESQANDLLVRLRNGEDFGALAIAYSLDTTTAPNGGDLGWFMQEELLEPSLAQVAFQLEPGQIAGPIQTELGYHIIQTLEKDTRPIDPQKRAGLAQSRFESWLNTLTITAHIEQYL